MTAAIIIAAIVLLLFILLVSPVRFNVSYVNGKLRFEVKYLFLTLFPFKEKKKKRKKTEKSRRGKKNKKDKTAAPDNDSAVATLPETEADAESPDENDSKGGKTKKSAAEIVELIKSTTEKLQTLYGSTSRGIKHLLAKLAVEDLDIHFIITSDEAAKTAVYYGAISAAVYNAVGFLRPFTTIYVKDLEIIPDFDGEATKNGDSVFDISFSVTIKVARLLSSGVLIGAGLLRDRKKYKDFLKKK